jgi:hypothetical protein
MTTIKTLGIVLFLLVGGIPLLLKFCTAQGVGHARELCSSIEAGLSVAALKDRAKAAGKSHGLWEKDRVEFMFPYAMDNFAICRLRIVEDRVAGSEVLDCGYQHMTPQEARGMGAEVAAQIPAGAGNDEPVGVRVCSAVDSGG